MKMVVAYVNPDKLWELKKKLFEIGAPGMSVDNFLGIGKPLKHYREVIEKQGAVPKFFPKTRVEIVCEDEAVDKIISTIVTTCKTGNYGDGKIFVLPVEEAIRIRTGEKGEDALK